MRLAVGLDFPLEVVGTKEAHLDDADPGTPGSDEPAPGPEGSAWQQAGVFGATMFGGSVLPLLLGGRGIAYAGLGLLGGATIGVAMHHHDQAHRQMACFVGAGLIAAAIFGLARGAQEGTARAT